MLVGYVSDERFVAIADVLIQFERAGESMAIVRSTPRGAVYADLEQGAYTATLVKDGFGSKSVEIRADPAIPYHFRLLSDRLLGYAWPKWVRSGERSEFRVHSVDPYRLSLWRYGYKREFVKLIGWFDEHGPRSVMQITPDGDYTQTGIQWNRVGWGSPHHTQFVTAPERSGLYYFHAETERGDFFSFPWVVAPEKAAAPLAALASTNTWNAYNSFGGRGNYVNATHLPDVPTVNARQDLLRYSKSGSYNEWSFADEEYAPLSFDRPEPHNCVRKDEKVTDPIRGRSECHLGPAEWRMLGWLEREGFGYDLYSEYQLHSGVLNLDAYKALAIGVHPEYWSRTMYERIKDWVWSRGGKLIYLGGNGLNCEIEFPDNATMRCNSQVPDPGGMGTTQFESRFHRRIESEANLLGVVCDDRGIMTSAPYRVMQPGHWIFEGAGLKEGDLFGHESLHERVPGGASGHETDKRSGSSPANTVILAKGVNPDGGGAEMAYYETSSGGAVYSAGSITYAASLLIDDLMAKITRTVIERMLK